jgi:hypothetical protein
MEHPDFDFTLQSKIDLVENVPEELVLQIRFILDG